MREWSVSSDGSENDKGRGQNLRFKRLISDPVDRSKAKGTQDYSKRKDSPSFFSKIGDAIEGLFSKAPAKDHMPTKWGYEKDNGRPKYKMRSKMKGKKKMIARCEYFPSEIDSDNFSSQQYESIEEADLKGKKRSLTRSDITYHPTETVRLTQVLTFLVILDMVNNQYSW